MSQFGLYKTSTRFSGSFFGKGRYLGVSVKRNCSFFLKGITHSIPFSPFFLRSETKIRTESRRKIIRHSPCIFFGTQGIKIFALLLNICPIKEGSFKALYSSFSLVFFVAFSKPIIRPITKIHITKKPSNVAIIGFEKQILSNHVCMFLFVK